MLTTRRALTVCMFLYLGACLYLMYSVTVDPDPDERKLSRLNLKYRAFQAAAERLGELGLRAEKEYLAAVESGRTI